MTLYRQNFRETAWADLSLDALNAKRSAARAAIQAFKDERTLPLLGLPYTRGDFNAFQGTARALRSDMDDVVICGTGGSSLGAQALYALADQGFGPDAGIPRQHFMDNVDPVTFAQLTEKLDPAKTACIIVSKSGTTAETISGFVTLLSWMRAALGDDRLPQHCVVITEPKSSPIRELARRFGLTTLDHDPLVGGRFSVMSLVGLLPALTAGLDIGAFRTGAAAVLDAALASDDSDPMDGAVYAVAQANAQRGTSVLMPYCDRLADFGLWYRQLWAESLGKDGQGTTPVRAVGTVDQHSQMQLYKDGPDDKFYTVVTVDNAPSPQFDDSLIDADKLGYLIGRNLTDLMASEAKASIETLVNSGRPMRTIALAKLDMETLGALMMHFMLETMFAAQLMGVDAYDQPAVEESKILTRQYMNALKDN